MNRVTAAAKTGIELRGARVRLRPFTASDITPRYLSWLSDQQVNQYSRRLGRPPETAENARSWLVALGKDERIYAIETASFGHIGNIKYGPINWSNLAADVSILVGEVQSWGHGFGAEATYLISKHLFFDRGVNRLAAASINPAFIRMVEKLGWQREGVQREESRVAGRFCDSILLSLLKRDFRILSNYEAVAGHE
jgi:ribosomal-protein-alanine N-acetyltransferase